MLRRKKVFSITLEVVALAILTAVVYWGTMILILHSSSTTGIPIIGVFVSSRAFRVALLIFNVIWIATIKFWPLKNIHIKIVLTLIVLAFSAVIATIVYMMPSSFGF